MNEKYNTKNTLSVVVVKKPKRRKSLFRKIPFRTITVWDCISLTIGNILSAGVLLSAGNVLSFAGSIEGFLLCWFLGGIIVFLGSLCYVELGTLYQYSGSDYQYLTRAFGEMVGFSYCWTMILLHLPGAKALMSLATARYLLFLFFYIKKTELKISLNFIEKITASIICVAMVFLNILQTKYAFSLQKINILFKICTILFFAFSGFIYSLKNGISETSAIHGLENFDSDTFKLTDFGFALYNVLWTYDGWNSTNFVAGEIINPKASLLTASYISIPIITLCYILANVSYLLVLTEDVIRKSRSIAIEAAFHIYGNFISNIIVPISISIIALSSLNGLLITGSKVIHICSIDGLIPKIFSYIHPKTKAPIMALLLDFFLVCCFIFTFSFSSIIRLFVQTSYLFFFLSTFSLFIFRWKEQKKERAFRVWLPVPIIFISISAFLFIFPFFTEQYLEAVFIILSIALSIPAWVFLRFRKRN